MWDLLSRTRRVTSCCSTTCKRLLGTTKSIGYVDEWMESIIKSEEFYSRLASGVDGKRCYFYNIDLQGRLFLEESMPKNIATSIKDTRFLDFFFRRLQVVNETIHRFMVRTNIPVSDYPFVSPCGNELNFIRPAALPIVFHSLMTESNNGQLRTNLLFGGSMQEPFDELHGIAVSEQTGKLYHKLTSHSLQGRRHDDEVAPMLDQVQQFGLIRSSVAVALSDRIIPMDHQEEGSSGLAFETQNQGLVPIQSLPTSAEPGSWALPDVGY